MDKWIFSCPAPECGETVEGFYNAGPMLKNDKDGFTDEDSKMQIVKGVTRADFDEYKKKLSSAGYKIESENEIGANAYFDFGEYHAAYFEKRGEIRVTEDKIKTPLDKFGYTSHGGKTTVYQYGLYYDKKNQCTETTVNCGMIYVIKLCDDSLVMIDGGHLFQWNEEAEEGLWNFLKTITNSKDGKVRIAAWYFTHAHDDHTDGCTKLLRRHGSDISLERVMFNMPSYKTVRGSYSDTVFDMKKTISELYPNAMLLKVHSGYKFTLADAEFEFMYAHEDAVNAENPAVFPPRDFNCTSSVFRLTVDGKTVMFLGDTNVETEKILSEITERVSWKSDFVQVAHHCFNYLDTLYEWINAPIAMLPNSYFGGHTPENTPKLAGVIKHLETPDNIYYEGEGTYGFEVVDGKWKKVYEAPVTGGEYDHSGF